MTTAKHTPGPWTMAPEPDKTGDICIWEPASDWAVGLATAAGGRDPAEVAANAKLMKAAPALLAACQAFLREMEEKCTALGWKDAAQFFASCGKDESYTLARAAVADAT